MTPLLHIEHTNAQRALKFSVGAAFVPLVALAMLALLALAGYVQPALLWLLLKFSVKVGVW